MNKTDIIRSTSKAAGHTQAVVSEVLDAMAEQIRTAVSSGDTVDFFGLFKIRTEPRAEREGRNPKTGASIMIPAKQVVKITPARALSDAANN